ncbi:MoxR family ATPase [candidate division KSB1 bacterium]|nr:MoxR family ATPase [candidate division KSB1 bacterium]
MKNTDLPEKEIGALLDKLAALKKEIRKVIIGQEAVVDELLMAFLAGGHCLLEGVPGLAKTLMIRTLAEAVHISFNRIQFTPDLMPSDIIGTEILEEEHATGKRFFKFNKGPIFTQVLLADEINRTPPKTQSALLEAMQEFAVTYSGTTYALDRPFFVLATQNPIEQAGTYPLPEAQLDRFLLFIKINYPQAEEEFNILTATTGKQTAMVEPILSAEEIRQLQTLTREVYISEALVHYVNDVVRASRPGLTDNGFVKEWVRWGAGPRAGQAMIMTAKAAALQNGRFSVTLEDLSKVAKPVLRHRILINFKGEAEGITADAVTDELLRATPKPKSPLE